ncbi:flagellar biosynthetic protein FliQ [bacterium]|nr:flagellar biosynthetic protein FliQ [bacterium]
MEEVIVRNLQNAMTLICYVSAPILLVALSIKFLISFLQAVTQIQEQTLSFVPKILAVFLTLILSMSWMIRTIVTFAQKMLTEFPLITGWK